MANKNAEIINKMYLLTGLDSNIIETEKVKNNTGKPTTLSKAIINNKSITLSESSKNLYNKIIILPPQ